MLRLMVLGVLIVGVCSQGPSVQGLGGIRGATKQQCEMRCRGNNFCISDVSCERDPRQYALGCYICADRSKVPGCYSLDQVIVLLSQMTQSGRRPQSTGGLLGNNPLGFFMMDRIIN